MAQTETQYDKKKNTDLQHFLLFPHCQLFDKIGFIDLLCVIQHRHALSPFSLYPKHGSYDAKHEVSECDKSAITIKKSFGKTLRNKNLIFLFCIHLDLSERKMENEEFSALLHL